MTEEVDLEQLNRIHPKLRPYVKVLMTHEFGLLQDPPRILNIQCGGLIQQNEKLWGDRFQLKILYCRKPLSWIVLMNGNDIHKAPDFIMEDNFLSDVTPNELAAKVPSLVNWCPSDANCLLNVVLELLHLYKCYQVRLQINLLQANPNFQRYLFEYDTLISMAGKKEEEVELCVQLRNPIATFLIHLNVDFSKLPIALPDSKDLVVLVVEFKDNSKNTIQLVPRIELEDVLGGPLDLPNMTPDISLMDYVPELEFLLQQKVEKIVKQTQRRKMLYSYLVQLFEPSLVNGDNSNFKNVSFLLQLDEFFCILNVHIPTNYPETRPDLQFLSIFKESSTRSQEYNSFEFDQNMKDEEVAIKIFEFVRDVAIKKFEKENVRN